VRETTIWEVPVTSFRVFLLAVVLCAIFPVRAEAVDCTRRVNDVTDFGPALSDPVVLSPDTDSEQRLKNFDGNRGTKVFRDIRLVSDKRLPDALNPGQINFDALIERAADKLESVDFPDPTFTAPRISTNRKQISFDMCLNAKGVSPGKYVGNVTVSGPDGLGEARVGITANLKARFLIWLIFAAIAMLFACAAMFFKDWTKDKTSIDRKWWFKTIGTLVVAFGALAAVYLNDPTWGAGLFASFIALVGTALAAVGGRKLIE
jgi:hypothetical protein